MKKYFPVLMFLIVTVLILEACSGTPSTPTLTPEDTIQTQEAPITIAEASVVPIRSANLNFEIAGIVQEIIKPEGTKVRSGETIARLQRQEELEASLATAMHQKASARQELSDLVENGALNKANLELALANADKELKDARKRLSYQDYKRGSKNQINEAQARYIIAQDAYKTANDKYSDLAGMADDNLTKAYALTILAENRHNRDRALADLNYLKSKPDIYNLHIAQSEVEVAQANYEKIKLELSKLNADGLNPEDLAVAEANLKNADLQIIAVQDRLDKLDLKAPFDGTVVFNSLKIGETTGIPGMPHQVVLADQSEWLVETKDLSEVHIEKIRIGDPVQVKFDALPDLIINGVVLRIQPLGTDRQGDITYKATIRLDEQDESLRWNMTALVSFLRKTK
ncbi:MAG: HlyD family secretion protein [Anaerolineaceae bacterium]